MVIPELISLAGTLLSAVSVIIVAQINKESNEQKKVNDEREERHKKQMLLTMEMIDASIELGDVNAVSLQQGKLNGNVEEARRKAKEARNKYQKFLADVASEVI